MTKKITIGILFITLTIFLFWYFQRSASPLKSITVGNTKIAVEIADNESKRIRGLSNRTSLPDNQGMLFVYDRPGRYTFWMNKMLFPLDFIFIKKQKVVNMVENIPNPKSVDEAPVIINQNEEFDSVLEVNAGFVQKNGIKIGDKVNIN